MSNPMPLAGLVALITGASRGIGAAMARAFGAAGAEVIINCRNDHDAAAAVQEDITAVGGRAHVVAADVGNEEGRTRLWVESVGTAGRIDVLVNNAAVEARKEFVSVSPDDWADQIAINLTAPYFLSQVFARHRIERGGDGCIINISSTHETRPMPRNSVYNISKAGLGMLTKSLALELAPHRIRVNGIVPGAIRTDMNRKVLSDPAYEAKVVEKIPLGRIASPEDLVASAVFLASPGAGYITGSTITVDGGLIL